MHGRVGLCLHALHALHLSVEGGTMPMPGLQGCIRSPDPPPRTPHAAVPPDFGRAHAMVPLTTGMGGSPSR